MSHSREVQLHTFRNETNNYDGKPYDFYVRQRELMNRYDTVKYEKKNSICDRFDGANGQIETDPTACLW